MRRLLHAALILLLAAAVPTVAMAEVCGGMAMPCCGTKRAESAALSRPGCCTAPCFETSKERREPASETRQVRLDLPLAPAVTLTAEAPLPPSAAQAESEPAVSPPVSRRLASLSTLLI